MEQPLHFFDLVHDCRTEVYRRLDPASLLMFQFTCKRAYNWNKPRQLRGLKFWHRSAALCGGYLSYLNLFWEMGMLFTELDAMYLNPNNLECLQWWFTHIEYTDRSAHEILEKVIRYSTNPACIMFVLDQLNVDDHLYLLPVLYERSKSLLELSYPANHKRHPTNLIGVISLIGMNYYCFSDYSISHSCLSVVEDMHIYLVRIGSITGHTCLAAEFFDFSVVDYLVEKYPILKSMIIYEESIPGCVAYSLERGWISPDVHLLNKRLEWFIERFESQTILWLLRTYQKLGVKLLPPCDSFIGTWKSTGDIELIRQLMLMGVQPDTTGQFLGRFTYNDYYRAQLKQLGFK